MSSKGENGKCLTCKGITTKIDPEHDTDITYDDNGRFYTINHKLADVIIAQDATTIPVCIQHIPQYKIGHVTQFYKDIVNNQNVLVADFNITSQAFINALSKQAAVRYHELEKHPYVSPDQFVVEHSNNEKEHSENTVKLDGKLALTQKFAGISLSHDAKTKAVTELSICLAGARDLTIILEVEYTTGNNITDIDKHTEEDYLTLFSAALSYSNYTAIEKVTKDLSLVGGDQSCLFYMHKLPQIKDRNSKMDNTEVVSEGILGSILHEIKKLNNEIKHKSHEEIVEKQKMSNKHMIGEHGDDFDQSDNFDAPHVKSKKHRSNYSSTIGQNDNVNYMNQNANAENQMFLPTQTNTLPISNTRNILPYHRPEEISASTNYFTTLTQTLANQNQQLVSMLNSNAFQQPQIVNKNDNNYQQKPSVPVVEKHKSENLMHTNEVSKEVLPSKNGSVSDKQAINIIYQFQVPHTDSSSIQFTHPSFTNPEQRQVITATLDGRTTSSSKKVEAETGIKSTDSDTNYMEKSNTPVQEISTVVPSLKDKNPPIVSIGNKGEEAPMDIGSNTIQNVSNPSYSLYNQPKSSATIRDYMQKAEGDLIIN